MAILVKKHFNGVPDGECHPHRYQPGDEVTGDLAAVALKQGWAKEVETKAEAKAEAEAKAKAEAEAKAKAEAEAKAEAGSGK